MQTGDTRAMSQENVEDLIRAVYESLNLEKGGSTEEWWHDDGEFINAREDPDHATHRGVAAIREQVEAWFDAFPDLRVEPMRSVRTEIGRLSGATSLVTVPRAGSPWTWSSLRCGRSKAGGSGESRNTSTAPKPSKPWGCRSSALDDKRLSLPNLFVVIH